MENNSIISGDCWLAYFDIMGFKKRVLSFEKNYGSGHLDVYIKNFYEKILKEIDHELHDQKKFMPVTFDVARFSDSFIFYTPAITRDSFWTTDMIFRRFIGGVILSNFPVRGAMTIGDFYADKAKNVFLGPALIEAYKYAERQDWIGCIVCPMAVTRVEKMGIPLSRRSDYVLYDVPMKMKKNPSEATSSIKDMTKERLFAYRLSKQPTTIERHLLHMRNEICNSNNCHQDSHIARKYDNTLKFFKKTKLQSVAD